MMAYEQSRSGWLHIRQAWRRSCLRSFSNMRFLDLTWLRGGSFLVMNITVVSLGVLAAVLAAATVYAQAKARATLAVEYLVVEVPRWARENHCFSCHNNGD